MEGCPDFVFLQEGQQDRTVSQSLPASSPKPEEKDASDKTDAGRPGLLVRTALREGQRRYRYRASVPGASWAQGIQPRRSCSTPPDSPIRSRAYGMSAEHKVEKGVVEDIPMSPPLTPTTARHASSNSDVSIRDSKPELSLPAGNVDSGTISFPFWETDYEVLTVGPKAIKKVLGSGVWSDVYHAVPNLPHPSATLDAHSDISSPMTPRSRSSSASTAPHLNIPSAYAIKTPSSAAAQNVLAQEAHILSQLTRLPRASDFIVAFYGQDPRSGALVLKYMDSTLDSWITNTLNTLAEPARATKLSQTFPHIAHQLLTSLEWLKSHHCVHADIKPGNILISTTSPSTSEPSPSQIRLTDFSSATLTSSSSTPPSGAAAPPIGGGTWDFLPPAALHPATRNNAPTPSSDLWAAALTLLIVVTGVSPFAFAGSNLFQRREAVRMGDPLAFVACGDGGATSVLRLRTAGVGKWFRRVLAGKGGSEAVAGPGEWLAELGLGLE